MTQSQIRIDLNNQVRAYTKSVERLSSATCATGCFRRRIEDCTRIQMELNPKKQTHVYESFCLICSGPLCTCFLESRAQRDKVKKKLPKKLLVVSIRQRISFNLETNGSPCQTVAMHIHCNGQTIQNLSSFDRETRIFFLCVQVSKFRWVLRTWTHL